MPPLFLQTGRHCFRRRRLLFDALHIFAIFIDAIFAASFFISPAFRRLAFDG
jgi:hypothetical protein